MNDFVARMERSEIRDRTQLRIDLCSTTQQAPGCAPLHPGYVDDLEDYLWIDLQRAYDLHVAEKQLSKVLAKIPTITAA